MRYKCLAQPLKEEFEKIESSLFHENIEDLQIEVIRNNLILLQSHSITFQEAENNITKLVRTSERQKSQPSLWRSIRQKIIKQNKYNIFSSANENEEEEENTKNENKNTNIKFRSPPPPPPKKFGV